MTLFAFTYANACTAMKGFDTDKNKKLEDEERSKLVYYIEVGLIPYDSQSRLQGSNTQEWITQMWDLLYYVIPQMIIFFQNISQNANVDEDFDKMIEASEIGKPDQE